MIDVVVIGGPVAGHELAGLHLDSRAASFVVRGGTVAAFLADLGLTDRVVVPNPAGAWLHRPAMTSGTTSASSDGSMSVPLPKAGVLGIPGSPLAHDVRRVIGWAGALRAYYLDRLMLVLTIGREHSLGGLVQKRMGRRVIERLVGPVAAGVYTTSAVDLEIDVVTPGLNRALTTVGSLFGAVSARRDGAPASSAVGGLLDRLCRRSTAILRMH